MNVKRDRWWKRHLDSISFAVILAMLFVNYSILFPIKGCSSDIDIEELNRISASEDDDTPSQPKQFDPNTASYRELIEAGLPRKVAVGIIRWREAGKVYRIKEDLVLCNGMTDSLYFAIESQIVIDDIFKFHPEEREQEEREKREERERDETKRRRELKVQLTRFSLDTVGLRYLTLVGFSAREAQLVLRYRGIIGGYRTFEEFVECYAVDSTMAKRLEPYLIFPELEIEEPTPRVESVEELPIEINSADSATLCRVRGIGPKSAHEIVRYRKYLGGFYCVEQISEISCVTPENFKQILPQIYCDSAEIKKININFAASSEIKTHPYITSKMLRVIIDKRVLKGGWSTIQEMIDDDIFTSEEAMRIAPYLDFGTDSE